MIRELKFIVLVMLVSYIGLWIISGIVDVFMAKPKLLIVAGVLIAHLLFKIAKEEL